MKKSTKISQFNLKQKISFLPLAKRPAIASLDNILVSPTQGGIHLAATDLVISARLFHPCNTGSFDPVLVPIDIIKSIKEIESIQTGEGYGIINGIKFNAVNLEEYPVMPDFFKVNCMADKYVKIPKGMDKYASKNEMRQAMNGINLSPNGWTATDAHRLMWVKSEIPVSQDVILPVGLYQKISKYAESMYVTPTIFEEGSAKLIGFADSCGKAVFTARPIEAKYPDYKCVIPETIKQEVTYAGLELAKELDKLMAIKPVYVKLSVNGSMQISAQNLDLGTEYNSAIPCSHTGEDTELCLNPAWLKEAITDGIFQDGFNIAGRANFLVNDNDKFSFLMVSNHNG